MRTILLRALACFSLLAALLVCPAIAEESPALDVGVLSPVACPAGEEGSAIDLYLGPTQGYYRPDGLTLDLSAPYVFFGQYDCWAMVASGTPEDMGPIGWVEAAAAAFPEGPLLSCDDALPVMVEDDTYLTAAPFSGKPARLYALSRGTQVLLLAQLGDWGYVQAEIEGTPVRAFLPASAIL